MGFTYLLLVVDQEDSLWLTLTRSRLNLVDMVTACLKCSLEKTPEFGGHGDGLLKVFSGKDLHHKEIYAYGCGNDWRLEE